MTNHCLLTSSFYIYSFFSVASSSQISNFSVNYPVNWLLNILCIHIMSNKIAFIFFCTFFQFSFVFGYNYWNNFLSKKQFASYWLLNYCMTSLLFLACNVFWVLIKCLGISGFGGAAAGQAGSRENSQRVGPTEWSDKMTIFSQ